VDLVEPFRGGLDFCIYLTTAQEYDGSCREPRSEKPFHGQGQSNAKKMTVEGDATITLP
jgi:deoxyhypusine synthase